MEKRTIGILFGGASSEHDVSLMSATSVLENIDREKYDVIMVGITRDGRWMRYTGDVKKLIDHSWEEDSGNLPAFLSPDRSVHGLVTVRDGQMEITRLVSPVWAPVSAPAPSAWIRNTPTSSWMPPASRPPIGSVCARAKFPRCSTWR